MKSLFPLTPAIWGYAFAALVFGVFLARLLLGWRNHRRSWILALALLSSLVWSAAMSLALSKSSSNIWWIACAADAIRVGMWLLFLSVLFQAHPSRIGRQPASIGAATIPAALILGALIFRQSPPWESSELIIDNPIGAYYFFLGAAVFGLVQVEKLYRQTPQQRRWAIKPLVIGLGGMFALDILIFSGAVLFHQVEPAMWAARGIAAAIVTLFVAVATARNLDWTIDVYVSREVVYQSTTLLIAGLYLVLVAMVAYWVHFFGGDWGGTLLVTLLFGSLLFLAAILMSGSFRARLKVLISKNLFSYRYDYRAEWLRFTRLLGSTDRNESVYLQVIRALADLVESGGGLLWLERAGKLVEVERLNATNSGTTLPIPDTVVAFLRRTNWIVELDDLRRFPERYVGLSLPTWLIEIKDAWLVVPLLEQNELVGMVLLLKPRAPIDINWEVRDLLKTASRQATVFLAQIRIKEQLVEAEKFSAFSRMSAFVIHDLKNLVAQLGLLLKNAERHRDNPEFQRDMLETVEHVTERMNHLMLQLRAGTTPVERPRSVNASDIVDSVCKAKRSSGSTLTWQTTPSLRALAHDDRLERVVGHVIQNAIDATASNSGSVSVRIFPDNRDLVVEVVDTGCGMSEEFIRERLFHPFQTTKPHGMGVGMYESFQYIAGLGGRIDVSSSPGDTIVRLVLPNAEANEPGNFQT